MIRAFGDGASDTVHQRFQQYVLTGGMGMCESVAFTCTGQGPYASFAVSCTARSQIVSKCLLRPPALRQGNVSMCLL